MHKSSTCRYVRCERTSSAWMGALFCIRRTCIYPWENQTSAALIFRRCRCTHASENQSRGKCDVTELQIFIDTHVLAGSIDSGGDEAATTESLCAATALVLVPDTRALAPRRRPRTVLLSGELPCPRS